MAEFPALPLWTDAYIADTQHLTNEEHGAYLRLLMFAWRTPNCSLPDDDKRLAIMIGVTPKKWATIKQTVMQFWTLKDGQWTQKKLGAERERVEASRAQKTAAGVRSAEARAKRSSNDSVPAGNEIVEQTSESTGEEEKQNEQPKTLKNNNGHSTDVSTEPPTETQRDGQQTISISISRDSSTLHSEESGSGSASSPDSAEPEKITQIVFEMKATNREVFPILQSDLEQWAETFPAVDIVQQLRVMSGWMDSNPKNRKTKTGMKRFIFSWLNREQNRGGGARPLRPSNFDQHQSAIHESMKGENYEPSNEYRGKTVDLAAGDFKPSR